MKNKPNLLCLLLLISVAVLECLLSVPLALLAKSGLTLSIPIYYLSRIFSVGAVFIMIGAVTLRMTVEPLSLALRPYLGYLAVSLGKQLPMAALHLVTDGEADFLSELLSGLLTSLISLALYLLLLVCLYLLLAWRREIYAENKFFSPLSTDCRLLFFATVAMLAYTLIAETVGIITDAAARLWLIDVIDVLNYLFIYIYDVSLFLLALLAGRWMQLRYVRALTDGTDTKE